LAKVLGLPVVELDDRFWNAGLEPTPADEWRSVQTELEQHPAWIMDGDLGPYDSLEPRLQRADTVVVLDVGRWRCLWRSLRRSRERLDCWRWLWTWRSQSRPQLLAALAAHAEHAHIEVLRSPADADRWLETVAAR
jgi:hypothetical protein